MIDIPVADVVEDAPTVTPEMQTVTAAQKLRRSDVPALVVQDGDEVVGIVRESDIVAVVAERGGNRLVASFMSTPVVTTSPTTTVQRAAERMRSSNVACLPVVDDGVYLGVVTPDALAPYVSRRRLDVDWHGDSLELTGTVTSGVHGD